MNRDSIPYVLSAQFKRMHNKTWGARYDGDRRYRLFAMCGTAGGAQDLTYGRVGPYEVCIIERHTHDMPGDPYRQTGATIYLCKSHLHADENTAVSVEY